MMKFALAFAALALLMPGALAGTVNVAMRGSNFDPLVAQAHPGDAVVWTNRDPVGHTVTALDGSFDSGLIPAGGSYARTFGSAGVVPYRCTIHPTMVAVLVVA